MRIGSLFSGYGGLDLGVQAVLGGEVAWHVEYDKAPSRILAHHYPDIPNFGDVTAVDFTAVEPVDVLTGGYPCQPFSHAGKRKGTTDERHLWPHVLRALREMGPRLAILENVRGHLTLGFDSVLADLADLGWSASWGVVRASDAGACHQRARLFILAYPGGGQQPWPSADRNGLQLPSEYGHRIAANAECCGREWCGSIELTRSSEDAAGNCQGLADTYLAGLERSQSETGRDLPTGGAATDADLSGGQAWRTEPGRARGQQAAGQREPVGRDAATGGDSVADPSGQRHGQGQGGRGLGRLDGEDAAGPREWEWARRVAGNRGHENAADSTRTGRVRAPKSKDNDSNTRRGRGYDSADVGGGCGAVNWGDYAPAIARWEHVIGRPAPEPTEPGRTGQPRLSPRFVEWMMGLPDGWVTDPAIGISRNDQLKALGNGVVPQQAALALSLLRDHVEAVAA